MASHSAEIVIIGGGVIGLSVARALGLRGVRDICLVEKEDLGTEASFAAAGMLAPQVEADADDEFFKLACRSRDMYVDFAARLLEETDVNVELDTTGTVYIALTEADALDCEKRFSWQTTSGFEVEKLCANEILRIEPSINPLVKLALFFPRDIQVENRRLVCALANSVNKLGVQILSHTRSDEIRTATNKVEGVETSQGFISLQHRRHRRRLLERTGTYHWRPRLAWSDDRAGSWSNGLPGGKAEAVPTCCLFPSGIHCPQTRRSLARRFYQRAEHVCEANDSRRRRFNSQKCHRD